MRMFGFCRLDLCRKPQWDRELCTLTSCASRASAGYAPRQYAIQFGGSQRRPFVPSLAFDAIHVLRVHTSIRYHFGVSLARGSLSVTSGELFRHLRLSWLPRTQPPMHFPFSSCLRINPKLLPDFSLPRCCRQRRRMRRSLYVSFL